MKTSTKVKLYSPVILALMLLCLSIVLIIVTFSLVYWLQVKSTSDNYGMWQGCKKGGDVCGRWYENGEALLGYKMTPSFKAFQATQTIYLAFTFFAFILCVISLAFFQKHLWAFVLSGFLIFFGTSSGIASLLVFIIDIYTKSIHYIGWCYWLSLSTIILNLIALIAVCFFTYRLKNTAIETSESELIKEFDYIGQSQNVQQNNENDTSTIQEISQIPASSPKVVRIVRTKELQSQPLSDSPKHTHYHSEYDVSKPPQSTKEKKYHRRFHYRQIHKLSEQKKHKSHQTEQFQSGYCSEPEIIEYSLDRCWVNADNRVPTSFETIESIDDSFDHGHRYPKAIYYDGQEHFTHQLE